MDSPIGQNTKPQLFLKDCLFGLPKRTAQQTKLPKHSGFFLNMSDFGVEQQAQEVRSLYLGLDWLVLKQRILVLE